MSGSYYIVRGTSAAEVERETGMRALDTPLGVLVKAVPPFRLEVELEKLDRILNPSRCRCLGFLHQSDCPMFAVT